MAAILALIGKPRSKRELLGVLEASDDQEKTADSRAAILETGDEECEKTVLAWEERNPHENGSYVEINGRKPRTVLLVRRTVAEEPGVLDEVRDG